MTSTKAPAWSVGLPALPSDTPAPPNWLASCVVVAGSMSKTK